MKIDTKLLVSILFLIPFSLLDAQPTPTPTIPAPSSTALPENAPAKVFEETRVLDAWNLRYKDEPRNRYHSTVDMGGIVEIQVRNLKSLDDQALCLNDSGAKIKDCKEQDLSLFLDGRLIKGLVPESKILHGRDGTLQFHLERCPENDETWADILGQPRMGKAFYTRQTSLSVGLANGSPVASDVFGNKFKLMRIRPIRFWICSILLIALIFLVFYKGRNGELLRDPWPKSVKTEKPKPYSLARFQIVFWFCMIITSFLFIWQITGATEIITPGVLALMGIGAGTVLGAAVIDDNKRTEKANALSSLTAEQPVLDSAVTDLEARIAGSQSASDVESLNREKADKQKRRNQVNEQIRLLKTETKPPESEGFLNDMLSDVNGINIHRLQMFAWTLVLGMIFVGSVWTRLSMPEFSTTLLAMQGLSAGTYLGFKIPEKQS